MGNIGSIFDCAVNPLHPAQGPDDVADEGPPKPVIIEEARPLRDSAIWALQSLFYREKGMQAWSEALVPHFVTSNSFIAKAYAKVILGLIRDTFEPGPSGAVRPGVDIAKPVYVLELGAGHGKLGYLIVETLLRYRAFYPKCAVPNGIPFKYIMTDAFPASVEAWALHPSLREFIDAGVLDVAVFDAERDTTLTLRFSGETLSPRAATAGGNSSGDDSAAQPSNPMLVIANYVFDSLRMDAFRVTRGGLEQACLSIVSSAPEDKERQRALAAQAALGTEPSAAGAAAAAVPGPPAVAAAAGAPAPPPDSALIRRMSPVWSYVPLTTAAVPAAAPPPPGGQPLGASGDVSAAATAALMAAGGGAPVRPSPRALASARMPALPGSGSGGGRVYGDPLLDSLLAAYAASPALQEAGSLLLPLGGIRAMRSLLALSAGKLVVLLGDKGYTRLSEMEGHRDPHMAVHGSFSFMVNLHAVRELVAAFGGTAMTTPYLDGFKVAAYFFGSPSAGQPSPLVTTLPAGRRAAAPGAARTGDEGSGADSARLSSSSASAAASSPGFPTEDEPEREAAEFGGIAVSPSSLLPSTPSSGAPTSPSAAPYPYTRWAFREGIQSFSPEDFSTLQRCVKEECAQPSLKLVLALLRLGNHDSEVFYKFKQILIDRSAYPQTPDNLQRDIRGDIDRVYASYYPLVASKDVCFELGRMLMGLREYATAIEFFNKSNELCGQHHVTWHNAGISFYYLADYESALECFKASLELKPDYGEARIWWDKTTLKSSSSGGSTNNVGAAGHPAEGAVATSSQDEAGGAGEHETTGTTADTASASAARGRATGEAQRADAPDEPPGFDGDDAGGEEEDSGNN